MSKQIEIIFKNKTSNEFRHLLIDYFFFEKSPIFPIAINYTCDPWFKDDDLFVVDWGDFWIVEAAQDGTENHEVLANILFRDYDPILAIVIDSVSDESRWSEVENLVQKIILKAIQLKFDIESYQPKSIMPLEKLKPWERLKGRDTQYTDMLRMWWEGQTNTEIARALSLSPEYVTTTLSRLRKDYGVETVITAIERRIMLRKS